MKYVKNFESFRNSKNEKINEEFIGGLFKNLKNKLSLGFSKMFGSASKVEKLMEEYKKEVMTAWTKKKDALLAIGKFQKAIKDGGEENKEEYTKLTQNLKTVSDNYQKQKDLIKKKFDIKFEEIVKEEKNEKIKNFINLKKIEMEQDLLQQESTAILGDSGLTEEDIKGNKELEEIMKNITDRVNKSQEAQKQQTDALKAEGGSGTESSFDFEAAKKDPENYEWKDSKYTKDYKFEPDEELKYWKKDGVKDEGEDYKGTTAFVMSNDEQKDNEGNPVKPGEIRVTTNKEDKENKGFVIAKSKVISTKKDEEESAKKAEEESKKEETTKEEGSTE
jgi:hypothetical protein